MPAKDPKTRRAANERYYANHRDEILDRQKQRRIEMRQIVRNAKSVPCADCGRQFPYFVMDFHHEGDDKEAIISDLIQRNVAVEKLLAEIEKCIVICSNCHRVRTYVELL
jgi:hypothetical protein